MAESALEALREARSTIAAPEHWCKKYTAVNAEGNGVKASDESAVAWCALGALWKVARPSIAMDARQHLRKHTGGTLICDYNDSHEHGEVLGIYDQAIAGLAAEQPAQPKLLSPPG